MKSWLLLFLLVLGGCETKDFSPTAVAPAVAHDVTVVGSISGDWDYEHASPNYVVIRRLDLGCSGPPLDSVVTTGRTGSFQANLKPTTAVRGCIIVVADAWRGLAYDDAVTTRDSVRLDSLVEANVKYDFAVAVVDLQRWSTRTPPAASDFTFDVIAPTTSKTFSGSVLDSTGRYTNNWLRVDTSGVLRFRVTYSHAGSSGAGEITMPLKAAQSHIFDVFYGVDPTRQCAPYCGTSSKVLVKTSSGLVTDSLFLMTATSPLGRVTIS